MKRHFTIGITAALLALSTITSAWAQNLLKNPGFEDPAGWSTNWTIRDAKGGHDTYHYHLTAQGGGHGDAGPHTGKNALEIYSDGNRQTYLTQKVALEPGTYRLSAWVRANGLPLTTPFEIALGAQKAQICVISQKYRLLWADFKIDAAKEYDASFQSTSCGMAIDDMSLVRVTANTPKSPALHIELYPGSRDHARNIQNCLKGSLQWVDIAITCVEPTQIKKPVMRILASDPVKLSGLNEAQIHNYRMRQEDQVKVDSRDVVRDGKKYREFSFALPGFVGGYLATLHFGGFWLSNVPAKGGKVIMEIVDGEDMLASEVVSLVVIDPPKVCKTPKKYYIYGYMVQNWMQALEERKQAIPAQFKMMGLNVWSDYFSTPEKPSSKLNNEELVQKEAYEKYGVREFWPNFSSMLDTYGGVFYSDISEKVNDKDMYLVGQNGSVNKGVYNPNYAANKGRAWMESSMAAWTRVLRRPREMNLPFRYMAVTSDALEGVYYSYDPSTLAAFAASKGVDAGQVTLDKLSTEWKKDWQLFNMELYARVVDIWNQETKRVDPGIKTINTAGTYGPYLEGLTPAENMKWARSIDYNMPQWYGGDYYGPQFAGWLKDGEDAKVFGKANGGTDLIPLLDLSMGGDLIEPAALRFTALDYFSGSKSIKGVGYYIAYIAFSDAKCMVGLSGNHTLIAEVEDFYADGVRDDGLVAVGEAADDEPSIVGMDIEGKQIIVKPKVTNSVRVHRLNKDGRIALITVISYNDQGRAGVGGRASLQINKKMLPNGGKNLVLIDRLTGRKQSLPDKIIVDTKKTNNVAVYEIAAL